MHELRDPVLDGLADEALDRRPVAFCSYLPTRLEDVAELADEALDRPAHPNLACISVSTGEFTKHADGADLADEVVGRPARSAAATSRRVRTSRARAR